ncbi:uncharacterized protein BKA78DRAFT_158310 [Phyllosticta capitalensis]|uniref:uncharacterized protein n=1 Tax=Phyllosticta capitalensis TaxID=121624 RepID=UPI00312F0F9F
MSGFEIAGIVLGAIPLIELYRKHVRNLIRYGRIFDDLELQLHLAMADWGTTCETLLMGLSLPIDALDDRKGWDDQQIQEVFKAHMGVKYYELFRNTAEDIRSKLSSLRSTLEPPEDWQALVAKHGKGGKAVKNVFRDHWKRIKGGFTCDEHDRMIKEVIKRIGLVERIVPKAVRLAEQQNHARKKIKSTKAWAASRDHSQRLYKSLMTFWFAKQCPSHRHCAQMHLNIPCHEGNLDVQNSLDFSFILKDIQGASHVGCYHTNVIPICSKIPIHGAGGTPSITVTTDGGQNNDCNSKTSIDNLCVNLAHKRSGGLCRGVFHDKEWHYHVHDDQAPRNVTPERMRSLREAILGPNAQPILSTREKRTISLLLASAVLRFHETSWLNRAWTMDDILFSSSGGETHLSIAKDFGSPDTVPAQSTSSNSGLTIPHDEMVFSLGIALLEINYRRPLSPLKDALLYAKQVQNDELQNFASAVASCIFHNPSIDFGSDGFLNWFYQTVITPLQDDYDMLQQTRPSASFSRS